MIASFVRRRYGILNTCNKMDSEGWKARTDYKLFVKTHGRKRNESDYDHRINNEQILLSFRTKARRRFFLAVTYLPLRMLKRLRVKA